ncbi:RepB family DNA primase [Alicycliphilus denitrificans]|uniref:RepB family DNA primase n=1 Tax=Alicycliphilus denitrificans TaxID=179636 RepID=UPI00384DB677
MADLTTRAVEAQLNAMGSQTFDVGVFIPSKDMMITKTWDKETVLKSVGYLKYQNQRGAHIYVRPAGEHNLSMIDDLNRGGIETLRKGGVEPAAVVETSPGNFQAWVKHHKTLQKDVSTQVSKELASQYGGDPSSADWRHYGRLAGFTNCKPKYQQPNGYYPFVMLREARGQEYSTAPQRVAQAEQTLETRRAEEQQRRQQFTEHTPASNPRATKTINDFRNDGRYGGDHHRIDLAYATYALARGVSSKDVEGAIYTRDLSHKGPARRQDDYVQRTLSKAEETIAMNPQRTQVKKNDLAR